MPAFAKILLTFAVAMLLACVISPLAYWTVQSIGESAAWLAKYPFHRFFSRTTQICFIVLGIGLVFWLGVRRLSELGLRPNPQALRDASAGLAAALIPGLLLGAAYVFADTFRMREEILPAGLLRILLTAGAVACIEEFLFRGVLLGLAARTMGAPAAAVTISGIFAAVHFLRPAKTSSEVVTWSSGFEQAASTFSHLPPPALLAFGLLSLFVAGLILAWLTLRTQSLWPAIGLHAGWIVIQQGLNWYAKFRAKPADEFLPWVGPNLVSGVVPTGLLPLTTLFLSALLLFLYLRYVPRRSAA